MTGLDGQRVYLDWNASAPLRPEARAAMLDALDIAGNPSSVHAEGRAARAVVERARGQVAALVGCEPDEVVFTSGATEAISMVAAQGWDDAACTPLEHDAVRAGLRELSTCPDTGQSLVSADGAFLPERLAGGFGMAASLRERGGPALATGRALFAIGPANAETGVLQPVARTCAAFADELPVAHCLTDATQAVGKTEFAFSGLPAEYATLSAHKIGGARGVGALIVRSGIDVRPIVDGGGQESGRRSGTENVTGIAAFGAAAEAARRDLLDGAWERVADLRDQLEHRLETAAPDLILFGRNEQRLPNTSYFAVPGWTGETQVMQMDMAGFAISAGSACASGKVRKASRVLAAMGFDEVTAASAIRVSIGPTTTEAEAIAFADAWIDAYRRRKARAA